MALFSALEFCLLVVAVGAQDGCPQLESEVTDLRQKLSAAEAKIGSLQGEVDSAVSVIGIISHTSSLAGDSVKHLMDKTDLDDQVYDKVCGHLGTAKAMTADFLGRVSALDYSQPWNAVTQHDVYKTHIAPTMDAAHKTAQPYMKEYVNPALEKAHDAVKPGLETATKHMNENVYPALQRHTSTVYEHADLNALSSKLGNHIEPIFAYAGKVAPKLVKFFPSGTWDRTLFLLVALISFYYFLLTSYFFVKKAFWMTRATTSIVIQLFIVLPLWVLWKMIRLVLCIATCGFCCGLCWSSKKGAKTNGVHKNGKTNEKVEATMKVSLEDVGQLLEGSKKKGKVEDAAKLLVTHALNGKPLVGKSFPENVKNKVLDVATLKKALAKYKEVDMKKLGL